MKRKAVYCNAKVLLMFLVIYGHLIETRIGGNEVFLWQYRMIYSVHIPLFAFLSGLFLKSEDGCLKQMWSSLKYYILCQTAAMLYFKLAENRELSFFTPYWHLWYLLSLFFWAGICYVAVKVKKVWMRALILLFSVVLAGLAGYEQMGRLLSLSRTVTFLPFVLLGCYLPKEIDFKKYRLFGGVLGGIAVLIFMLVIPQLPVEFLYGADGYQKLGIVFGPLYRILFLLLAAGIGAGIFSILPRQKIPFSYAGVETLLVYLLHGPIVKIVRNLPVNETVFWVLGPLLAAAIYGGLYLVFCRRAKQYQLVT